MCHQNDHYQPYGVLQQPTVDQQFGRWIAVYFVVDVEQGHHPEQEHREAHLYAEQMVEHVDCLAGQPVFDAQRLHRIGRTAPDGFPTSRRRSIAARRRVPRGGDERILNAVRVLVPEPVQLVVDLPELGVHQVTLRGELRLDAAHAQVLDVYEQIVDQ